MNLDLIKNVWNSLTVVLLYEKRVAGWIRGGDEGLRATRTDKRKIWCRLPFGDKSHATLLASEDKRFQKTFFIPATQEKTLIILKIIQLLVFALS